MIERIITDDGRKATVAYIDQEFNPVPKEKAELIKVIFDDGETLWFAYGRNFERGE